MVVVAHYDFEFWDSLTHQFEEGNDYGLNNTVGVSTVDQDGNRSIANVTSNT